MNTHIEAPDWSHSRAPQSPAAAALHQLVNAAGPISAGLAVALTLVRRAQQTEDDGIEAPLDATQRGQLIAFCAVAAQMLHEVAMDASGTLVEVSRH